MTRNMSSKMPSDMPASNTPDWEPMCWVNGLPVDPRRPALSVSERGFALGDGCFETMRSYQGVIFRLDQHLDRLERTADALGIAMAPHLDETLSEAQRRLRLLRADAAVRLTLTRGVGPGVAPPVNVEPTTVLLISHLPQFPAALESGGLAVRMAAGRRNEYAATSGLKTLAYADAVIALGEAKAAGADDAIMLDTAGHLSEGTSSNIFVVARGIVHTPPLSCGVLPGITRAAVLEILDHFDIPVDESPIPSDALQLAGELFLTSSLREIAPVTSVDGQPIGLGESGPITRRVQSAYRELVSNAVADATAGSLA
jgi:branched-chain amino acid aminotransferase